MTTPQRNGHRAHSPGRRPRPLEIILNGSNGDCGFELLLASQPALADVDSRLTGPIQPIALAFTRLWRAQQPVPLSMHMPPSISLTLNIKSLQIAPRTPCFLALIFELPTPRCSSFQRETGRQPQSQINLVPALSKAHTSVSRPLPKIAAATSIFTLSLREILRVRNAVRPFALILCSH